MLSLGKFGAATLTLTMSKLRSYRRHMISGKVKVAGMLARMQRIEPDPKALKDPAVFQRTFEAAFTQRQVEVFAPMAQQGAVPGQG